MYSKEFKKFLSEYQKEQYCMEEIKKDLSKKELSLDFHLNLKIRACYSYVLIKDDRKCK